MLTKNTRYGIFILLVVHDNALVSFLHVLGGFSDAAGNCKMV